MRAAARCWRAWDWPSFCLVLATCSDPFLPLLLPGHPRADETERKEEAKDALCHFLPWSLPRKCVWELGGAGGGSPLPKDSGSWLHS